MRPRPVVYTNHSRASNYITRLRKERVTVKYNQRAADRAGAQNINKPPFSETVSTTARLFHISTPEKVDEEAHLRIPPTVLLDRY